jgi:hypothetical protein
MNDELVCNLEPLTLVLSHLPQDEIYREKLKIKKLSDELDDTFDDMLANY